MVIGIQFFTRMAQSSLVLRLNGAVEISSGAGTGTWVGQGQWLGRRQGQGSSIRMLGPFVNKGRSLQVKDGDRYSVLHAETAVLVYGKKGVVWISQWQGQGDLGERR